MQVTRGYDLGRSLLLTWVEGDWDDRALITWAIARAACFGIVFCSMANVTVCLIERIICYSTRQLYI